MESKPLLDPKMLNHGVQACAGNTTHLGSASRTSSTSSGADILSVGLPSLAKFPNLANRSLTAPADSREGASRQWWTLLERSSNANVVFTSPLAMKRMDEAEDFNEYN